MESITLLSVGDVVGKNIRDQSLSTHGTEGDKSTATFIESLRCEKGIL